MKLGKAIGKLAAESLAATRTGQQDLHDALELGIEAIKVVWRSREGDPPLDGELLPGETEE